MRVMVLVKATKDSEAGIMPSTELLEAMGEYNEALVDAGILAGDFGGLRPSSKGKRVAFDGSNRAVIDGPFAETKEVVAGFWLWEVKCMAEAVEWVKRCPNPMLGPSEIEIFSKWLTSARCLRPGLPNCTTGPAKGGPPLKLSRPDTTTAPKLCNGGKESNGNLVTLRKARRSRQIPDADLSQSRQCAHCGAPRRLNNGDHDRRRKGLHRYYARDAHRDCTPSGSCVGPVLNG